jgi:hypothetical protein
MGITLAGFYFVAGSDWKRLLCCLLGFVLARLAVTLFTRVSQQVSHASSDFLIPMESAWHFTPERRSF